MVTEDLRAVFGRRVRLLRLAQGLSQEELAERAELHRNYIGGIERGERNVGILNIGRIAAAFGIPLAEMFKSVSPRSRPRRL